MGAWKNFVDSIKGLLPAVVPFGGTLDSTTEETPIIIAAKVRGGLFIVPDLETLADIPYQMLQKDMIVVVSEHARPITGALHLRTKYYLYNLPPSNTRVSEVGGYVIENYWRKETESAQFDAEVSVQYAPNYNGSRPLFQIGEISLAAYQAGYPTTAAYVGGNPADIIWVDDYDPALNHLWMRQRSGSQPWGIPIAISAGNYEAGQFIDVIFKWETKGNPPPARPVQPNDNSQLPAGWLNTPGADYATRILTEDLYRSQAIKGPYNNLLKSGWEIPTLVSSDPVLVRYGNQPGSTDFLNNTFWRGYFTPGRDTFQATRPNGSSTNWTVEKIDQESGEFQDFVFRAFPIGAQQSDLIDGTPTNTVPTGTVAPNDWKDAPFTVGDTEMLCMSSATKYPDGSLKSTWSVAKRFDGLDTIQTVIEETPGDTFYQTRNGSGNLAYAFTDIVMVAVLYKGPTAITAGITAYKWYRGSTLIIFSGITHKATNLGGLNNFHTVSPDGTTLTVNPDGVDATTTYKAGITHSSRTADYEDTIQLFDATDDNSAFVSDIIAVQGSTFKNQTGLFQFNANFYKGGVLDVAGVTFKWSIKDTGGSALTNALRNSGGTPIGDTNVVASSVYVQGSDISQYAVLILEADFGAVVRIHRITLTDVEDGAALEALYWGTGSTDPGPATDFSPRTLTAADVLALAIGYSATATGRWYMIQRVGGVWSEPIQLRAESARPNGGISLTIYKNVQLSLGAPAAPAVPGSGSLVPAGWTQTPTAFTGLQDATFISSCIFVLRTDVTADPAMLTRANYNPSGTYGFPIRITGIDGTNSSPGINGTNGWSPVFAVVDNGAGGEVLFLADWVGGTGSKPAGSGGTASYVGPSGLTTIGAAMNIKGSDGAPDVNSRPQSIVDTGGGSLGARIAEPSYSVAAPGNEVLQTMAVTNSWDQARWFIIEGEVGVKEGDSVDIAALSLWRLEGVGVPNSLFDVNRQRIDNVQSNPSVVHSHKLKVSIRTIIDAGATQTFYIVLDVDGGSVWHNGGYMMAFGI